MISLGLMGPIACGPVEATQDPSTQGRSGLALALRLDAGSDVASMRFSIERTSCTDESFTPYSLQVDRALEDIRLPGGIPNLEDSPLDGNSAHQFADLFIDLPEGCYNVITQPLASGGGNSQNCSAASTTKVRINDAQTTEILLINQCWGGGRGAIDVVSALNHPPALVWISFEDSRFVHQCTGQVVCATVMEPDGDPVEFSWTQVSGPALYSPPEVLNTTPNADGSVTQCIRVIAEESGRYELKVVAFDLLHSPAGGGLIRIEDYLRWSGSSFSSNDKLTFPFYAASDGRTGGCDETAGGDDTTTGSP